MRGFINFIILLILIVIIIILYDSIILVRWLRKVSTNTTTKLSIYETAYMKVCSSCGRLIRPDEKAVVYYCPNCGEVEITRCSKCRKQTVTYVCPICGFNGP